ncbi:SBBP repeat-containing protein [Polyangium jinanense]|uniref:SBBP repeat-containing protein n=1 Tax=Polyangium jinanense TaxID=2829994 RepID=A0A9X4AQF7_9BACT|nr:SBBP repeat-containing protein [Polyangium jinanense]MDC3952682.1 SBBP repeat-containing protein [Polyangium jinanense]MDC3980301.1 SBBP repeat-containing protein [Polyangium jinanense]
MKRTNLARLGIALAMMIASFGCAAPDAVPGDGGGNTGPTTGPGGPSTVVGTDVAWAQTFGDAAATAQRARDVSFDPQSNTLAVTVEFNVALDVPGLPMTPLMTSGGTDVLVLRYPADGSSVPLWGARVGGTGEQASVSAAIDVAGNVVVAGAFQGNLDLAGTQLNAAGVDVFLAKLDPQGTPLWVKQFGDGDIQIATDVAVDDEGNIIVVGYAKGAIDFGLGPVTPLSDQDLFVAKFDPAGTNVWALRPGRAADLDYRNPTIAVTHVGEGKVAVTGGSEGLLAFPPLALAPKGAGDAFLVVIDAEGKGVWGESYGVMGTRQRGYSVAAGRAGEVVMTGDMSGTVSFGGVDLESGGGADMFVALYDPAGKHRWSRRFGGAATQSGRGVAIDGDGNVLVTGLYAGALEFFGENAFVNVDVVDSAWDGFASKLDPTGKVVWAMSLSGPQQQVPASIAALSDGSAVVSGWYETELSPSGSQALPGTGDADGFILSLAP